MNDTQIITSFIMNAGTVFKIQVITIKTIFINSIKHLKMKVYMLCVNTEQIIVLIQTGKNSKFFSLPQF